MDLIIVRHAIAGDRFEFARANEPDSRRPVTQVGSEKMRKGARGLRVLVPEIDVLATSPYLRALQTAEIISEAYGGLNIIEIDTLTPAGSLEGFLEWLLELQDAGTVVVTGHEPMLSELISWFLSGEGYSFVRFKKGAACKLRFAGTVGAGRADLQWALTPDQLRKIGE